MVKFRSTGSLERMERISARQLLNKDSYTLMVYNHWTGRLMNWTTGPTVFHSCGVIIIFHNTS